MSRGDRRHRRRTRQRQFHPTAFDRDPTDRRLLGTLGAVALACLVALILMRWL